MSELEITDENFDEYFFDVRKHGPKRGQIMACYTATAEFVDGNLKRDITYLLASTNKAKECVQLLRKLGWANEQDAIRVCKEIAEDLHAGMHSDEIAEKVYKYKLEAFYYTQREYVPEDDPHWSTIELTNLDEHLDRTEGGTIKTKIHFPENEKNDDI
jgi:hypothetical protein